MTDLSYPDDPEAIERLRDSMLERQAERRKLTAESRFSPSLPPADCMARMLRVCFFASLWTDEGRQSQFSISYAAPEQAGSTFMFGEKKDLSPKNLVKLAPAVQMDETYIGVCEDRERLSMWGLIGVGSQDVDLFSRRWVEDFSIQALGPGLLLVSYLGSSFMALSKGKIMFTPHENRIGEILERSLSEGAEGPSRPTGHRAASIARIARRMLRHGHGGTLLVVPGSDEKKWRGQLLPGGYELESSFTALCNCLREWEAASRALTTSGNPTVDYWQRYKEAMNAIARFTAVDGATIIRSDLTVPAFGAFVRGSELGSDAMGELIFEDLFEGCKDRCGAIREVGGSRHQSAARFCVAVPGALAIVASQDGSVCFMTRPQGHNTVRVWGGIEFLLHGTWY